MPCDNPDVSALLADLRGVQREALDYLDHGDLETFLASANETHTLFQEQVEAILTERGRSRQLRGKRGSIH